MPLSAVLRFRRGEETDLDRTRPDDGVGFWSFREVLSVNMSQLLLGTGSSAADDRAG